ncbi:metacaspase-1 [[Candida] jaroonii]|uniref:Metacaspase-1 n=1 Tax=[Candida] jaroonii TaxID=467808 RepID=A0ACA9Y649_9ASCO|nr:metacaspase-1 [[Candida] jaroonii]
MFPGQGHNSYGGQRPSNGSYQQQYGGYNNYGPPQGAPNNYGPPQGAPPNNYGPPQGAPNNYNQRGTPQMPSFTPQRFDSRMDASFQYSNCTGRRKALLVGINYIGTSNELRGCINDVKNMSMFLNERYGYSWDDMVILTDDQRQYNKIPTRENILRAMQWLVQDARPNDSLFFHYSGHGGQTKDLDGDEESGMDDVIYPLDFQQNGHIVDDIMHDIMVRPLPQGCRLTALYDSCHSGTALDLPYVYSTKGVVKEPNIYKDVGGDALGAVLSYGRGNMGGVLSAVGSIAKTVMNSGRVDTDAVRQMKASSADVVSISGSKDDQTSADASFNGKASGAMSYAFISILSQNPEQSYISLLNNMRNFLSGKYTQKPQLSCSHPTDMNLKFIM